MFNTRVGLCIVLAASIRGARVKIADDVNIEKDSSANQVDIAEHRPAMAKVAEEAMQQKKTKFENAMASPYHTALLIIDVQDCFLPGGNLGVTGADEIIPKINEMRTAGDDKLWKTVALSQDYHPAHHISFASSHPDGKMINFAEPELLMCVDPDGQKMKDIMDANKKTSIDEDIASCCPNYAIQGASDPANRLARTNGRYDAARANIHHACNVCKNKKHCKAGGQVLWPDHCVQGTEQVGFSADLTRKEDTDIVVRKGTNIDVDSYSAFANNTNAVKTDLHDILQGRKPITTAANHAAALPEALSTAGQKLSTKIKTVLVTGIAEEVCVQFTAIHAKMGVGRENYQVILVKDAAKGLSDAGERKAETDLEKMGVIVVTTQDLLDLANKRR